ncbi:MAG: sugar transferase [Bacteroidetes bacterium]|nr:MAG: sugar transferase [Bacteroidota bacterium]
MGKGLSFEKQTRPHTMIYEQTLARNNERRDSGIALPESVQRYIERWMDRQHRGDVVLLNKVSELNFIHAASRNQPGTPGISCIVCLLRINDIPHINAFFKAVNQHLNRGGLFIGCLETCEDRKNRILTGSKWPVNKFNYFFDYLRKQVWPKVPLISRSYYSLAGETDRVISAMEAYGRLFSCGFTIKGKQKINDLLFFTAEKKTDPDFKIKPYCGTFICLNRVGKNGKKVKIYKLRTMYPYSEFIQEYIFKENGLGEGCKFKNDPRITPLGRYLRKYWIDELPMLYNLAKGDVKVFGVRPLSPHYFSLYSEEYKTYRSQFKPGLIPPLYVEIPETIEDVMKIEKRYLEAYEKSPLLTDLKYTFRAFYNIFIKCVRSH